MTKFDQLANKILGEDRNQLTPSSPDYDQIEREYAHLNAEEAKEELLQLLQAMRLKDTGVHIYVVEVLGDKILGGEARDLDMSLDELIDAVGEELDIRLDYIEGSKGELVTYFGL